MALPETVNTIYAPGSQVLSDDLNDIQESIVDIWPWVEALQGTKVRHVGAHAAKWAVGSPAYDSTSFARLPLLADDDVVVIPIPVDQGEQINAFTVQLREATTETATLKVYRVDASGATETWTQLGSTQTSSQDGGATQKTLTVSGLTEDVGAQHYSYIAEVAHASGTGGVRLTSALLTWQPTP